MPQITPALPPPCSPGCRGQTSMLLPLKRPSCLLCLLKPYFCFKLHSRRQILCGTFPKYLNCLSTLHASEGTWYTLPCAMLGLTSALPSLVEDAFLENRGCGLAHSRHLVELVGLGNGTDELIIR